MNHLNLFDFIWSYQLDMSLSKKNIFNILMLIFQEKTNAYLLMQFNCSGNGLKPSSSSDMLFIKV